MKSYRNLSYVISVVLVLVCLTFFGFFFNDPLQAGLSALTVTQFSSQFAWVFLVIGPPLLLSLGRWDTLTKTVFLVTALFWPATLLLIRIVLTVQVGDPYLGYLVTYPIFIFTDILVPGLYVWIWVAVVRETRSVPGRRAVVASDSELATSPELTSPNAAPVSVPATV